VVWARFSDDWADQPRVIALSSNAFRAYMEGMLYVGRYTTDGQIPTGAVKLRDTRAAPELVRAGLWNTTETGWYAPLWREHIPPLAELEKARAHAADRQRRRRGEQ
jgi:hypothetical protein